MPTPEGLRAWLADLDRRVGLRTYVGAAVVILAIATAIVAIVLAIDARDYSASNDDLNRVSEQAVADAAASGGTDVDPLESRIAALEGEISDLRNQISAQGTSPDQGGAGVPPSIPGAPGDGGPAGFPGSDSSPDSGGDAPSGGSPPDTAPTPGGDKGASGRGKTAPGD